MCEALAIIGRMEARGALLMLKGALVKDVLEGDSDTWIDGMIRFVRVVNANSLMPCWISSYDTLLMYLRYIHPELRIENYRFRSGRVLGTF